LILRRNGTEGLRLTSSTVQVSSINNGPLAGFRNAIINGNFDIWQRGTSFTTTSGTSYNADRWRKFQTGGGDGGSITVSRRSFSPGQTNVPGEPEYFLRANITSANTSSNINISQLIEDVRTFAGQTVTASYWAKADSNKTVLFDIFQNFGTGGSSDVISIVSNTISLTTNWQKFTHTVSIPSIAGKTIGANNFLRLIWILSGSSGGEITLQTISFDIAQVQLEAGPVATPFERRPIGTELALCQRYYQRGASPRGYLGNGTGTVNVYLTLPVVMRANPTVTYTPNIGTSIVIGVGSGHLNITGTISGGAPNRRIGLDDMKMEAEL
jgi:hypothetical protein